ncbi:hypothetical protein REPUB_Repub01dG0059900 [Reevesia pubescens]
MKVEKCTVMRVVTCERKPEDAHAQLVRSATVGGNEEVERIEGVGEGGSARGFGLTSVESWMRIKRRDEVRGGCMEAGLLILGGAVMG